MWYRIIATNTRGGTSTYDRQAETPLDALDTLRTAGDLISLPGDSLKVTPIQPQDVAFDY